MSAVVENVDGLEQRFAKSILSVSSPEVAMRVKYTNVARTTESTVTVEFRGDGNELVTVRMDIEEPPNDEIAIAKARAMLADLIGLPEGSAGANT